MKKAVSVSVWVLLILLTVWPFGIAVCACFGCTLVLHGLSVYAALCALAAAVPAALVLIKRVVPDSKAVHAAAALTAPLSVVHAVLLSRAGGLSAALIFAAVTVVCCVLTTIKCSHGGFKKVSLILTAVMVLPACLLMMVWLWAGSLGQETVVRTLESTGGTYYAEVIDRDEGALGGHTNVNVRRKGLDAHVFEILHRPTCVYSGPWGAHETLEIVWKSDSILVVDGVEHKVGD